MNACIHCDQEVTKAFYDHEIGPFCCQGCLTVHNIITMKGLSEYYDIKKNVSLFKKRAPVEIRSQQFSYLDDAEFLQEYSYRGFSQKPTMEFYLEGIHCLACLWIIEKIPEFVPNVHETKLNMGRSVVTVVLEEGGKFSDVARELESIGYHPHPLKMNQSTSELKLKEERSMLLRIGVAAAAAGNIMLYAVALYAGAGKEYEVVFNALTVIFALPVLIYSASPFYKNSYIALKNKTLSIDVPISMSLIMGGIMGVYNLLTGVADNYFDSLTALVFLLLLSRYFLKMIQEKGLSVNDLHFFYQGDSVLKQESSGQLTEIHPRSLKVNDIIKVLPNQIIPADGTIIKGDSYLNNSLLSGESKLQKVTVNDEVFSGTMNVSHEILIEVQKISSDSRLGKILKNVENGWGQKAKIIDITNTVSKYFVVVVLLLSSVLFFINLRQGNIKHALETALTLLIVTCPCALAIATPLTFIRTLSKSAQKGIILKDDLTIEKLAKAENVFIDKTGTLTQNQLKIVNFNIQHKPLIAMEDLIFTLEQNTVHPVGKSLRESILSSSPVLLDVNDLKEIAGVGVSGIIDEHIYEIKNYGVYEDGIRIATFDAKDALRSDAHESIVNMRHQGLKLKILSGDKKESVEELACDLKLQKNEYSFELSPEKKSQIIRSSKNTIMIGDGANDSIALSCADTGIAVYGAMDISLRAADVYLSYPGLSGVTQLITISRETMKVIYRNLTLSLCYNSISVALAFTGHISPLAAAVIMPLSSLTVLFSTLIGTKELRRQWKL